MGQRSTFSGDHQARTAGTNRSPNQHTDRWNWRAHGLPPVSPSSLESHHSFTEAPAGVRPTSNEFDDTNATAGGDLDQRGLLPMPCSANRPRRDWTYLCSRNYLGLVGGTLGSENVEMGSRKEDIHVQWRRGTSTRMTTEAAEANLKA